MRRMICANRRGVNWLSADCRIKYRASRMRRPIRPRVRAGPINSTVDDGVILARPADKLGRQLKLVTPVAARQEEIKAMTREQVSAFLSATQATSITYERRHYPLFLAVANGNAPL